VELLGRADAERPPDLDHPLRPDPEKAPEPHELRLHLLLQLVELGDRPRADELGQARSDPRTDAAQLLDATGGDEVGDRRFGLADRLRRAAVGPRRVEARA
jgi:hypothetical protein